MKLLIVTAYSIACNLCRYVNGIMDNPILYTPNAYLIIYLIIYCIINTFITLFNSQNMTFY